LFESIPRDEAMAVTEGTATKKKIKLSSLTRRYRAAQKAH